MHSYGITTMPKHQKNICEYPHTCESINKIRVIFFYLLGYEFNNYREKIIDNTAKIK